ncbi:O-succinylbenzoate--CoA ligase [Desulfonema magnum]|uniref:O-succinylbenzoate--CoA ligase n=1 Tax=Desulfonema magnum TaxID=45655 RepID=A0A975GSN9_9BACT|nr:O-succinylbenzoate--CoA ligase [Desulfonema magnum]
MTASAYPQKDAIIFEGRPYTFQDITREIKRTAALLKKLGVKKGDRVALQLPKSMEFIFFHLANLSIGAITLPLNTAFRGEEMAYYLKDSQSSLFVTYEKNYSELRSVIDSAEGLSCLLTDGNQDGVFCYSEEREHADCSEEPDYPAQDDDIALICYTSGTTGLPKGAMITHRNLVENMKSLQNAWEWTDQDILLHILPIFHVHGLEVALHGGLFAGSTIIMHEKFDPSRVWHTIEEKQCTMLMGVPTMYYRLLNQYQVSEKTPDIRSMRVFISGSAPLSEKVFEQFRNTTGYTILERYGMTEAGMITSNPIEEAERKAGSAGYPFPGVEIRIVDKDGEDISPGEVGEVCIRGDNVFKGYWRNPEKTEEAFAGDWLKSGDMGYEAPDDGMRLYLSGRFKELIITGGYNVYPKEVENVIDRYDSVRETAVIGLPDDDFGEKVTAVVVLKDKTAIADPGEIIAFCKKSLAGYKCPKTVFFREELPRNAMGKVQKHLLSDELQADIL